MHGTNTIPFHAHKLQMPAASLTQICCSFQLSFHIYPATPVAVQPTLHPTLGVLSDNSMVEKAPCISGCSDRSRLVERPWPAMTHLPLVRHGGSQQPKGLPLHPPHPLVQKGGCDMWCELVRRMLWLVNHMAVHICMHTVLLKTAFVSV